MDEEDRARRGWCGTTDKTLYVGLGRVDMEDEAREYRSIVILLPQRHRLSDPEMAAIAERSLGIAPDGDEDSEDWCLPVIEGGQYMLKSNGVIMILHNRAVPFFDDPEAVAGCIQGDPELAAYIRSHQAWLSVDSMWSDQSKAIQYETLCKVANEFVSDSAGALFVPEYGTIVSLNSERIDQMQAFPGLQGLGFEE